MPRRALRTADPGDAGFDAEELADLDDLIHRSYPSVRSLLVVRHGVLVYERYGNGADASDGHDLFSVTKSVVSALVGIALSDGLITSLDQTVGELLADHLPPDADPRMAGVTVRQLLTMTSGLPADDRSWGRLLERLDVSRERIRATLRVPLVAEPGSTWGYTSLSSNLLAAIVADVTGRSVLDFARERLFGPLGIRTDGAYEPVIVDVQPAPEQLERLAASAVAWPKDAQGYHWGGGGLRLPARDLAKLGYLYLDEGRWDGEQIVPADYVRRSTTSRATPTGPGSDYAWQWWISEPSGHSAFSARGYGGQVIDVVPSVDLVAVVTTDPGGPGGEGYTLVENGIVPAAED